MSSEHVESQMEFPSGMEIDEIGNGRKQNPSDVSLNRHVTPSSVVNILMLISIIYDHSWNQLLQLP